MVLITTDVYDSLLADQQAQEEERQRQQDLQRQAQEEQQRQAQAEADRMAALSASAQWDQPAQDSGPQWGDVPQQPASNPWEQAVAPADPWAGYDAPQAQPAQQDNPWDAAQYQAQPDTAYQTPDANYQAPPSWEEQVAGINAGLNEGVQQQQGLQQYNEAGYSQAGNDALAQKMREDQGQNPIDRSDASRWAFSQGYALDANGNLTRPGFADPMKAIAPAMSLNETLKGLTGGKANIEWLPDGTFEFVDALGSPVSLATMGLGGGEASLAANLGKNAAAVAGGLLAQKGTQEYSNTSLPGADIAGNPWVQQAAGLVGGVGGYMGAEGIGNAYRAALGPEGAVSGAAQKLVPGMGGSVVEDVSGKGLNAETAAAPIAEANGGKLPDIFQLPDLAPRELTPTDRMMNTLKRITGIGTEEDTIATPAMRDRAAMKPIVESAGNRLGAVSDTIAHDAFVTDSKGRITGLPGAPTIQDVAARLPEFAPDLTPRQAALMEQLRQEVTPYQTLLAKTGIEVGSRPDVVDGGFYLPRGRADVEGLDSPIKVGTGRGGIGGKAGFEKSAVFDSMGQGIDAGYEYTPFAQTMESYGKTAGQRALDQHVANYFKTATDPVTGELLGQTPHARLLEQNPGIAKRVEGLRKSLDSLKGTAARLSDKQTAAIDEFLHSPAPDVDTLRDSLDIGVGLNAVGKAGPNFGKTVAELRTAIKDVRTQINDLAPDWRRALEKSRAQPRDQGSIGFAQLGGTSFPEEMANAANKVLNAEKPATGHGTVLIRTTAAVNGLLQGVKASADVSYMGIQGLLGAVRDPVAYGKALETSIQALGDDRAIGAKLLHFDEAMTKAGRPTSRDWIASGLHIGGADTEFQVGRGVSGKIGNAIRNAPVIKQSNRAFGYFGDSMRLELADSILDGKSITPQIMKEVTEAANLATGWAPHTFVGSVGQLGMFAPRFFQSQLDILGNALTSGGIQGSEARRQLLTLMGAGTLLTVAANKMAGDNGIPVGQYLKPFNGSGPFGDPRSGLNSNFMRFRAAGQDYSFFGPWDSLLRGVVALAGGDATYMLRTKSSPVIGGMWDLLSGKTFTGQDSRTPEAFLRNLLPFSLNQVGQQSLAATAIGATGIKSSPTTPNEQRDQAVHNSFATAGVKQSNGKDINGYYDLNGTQRKQWDAEHGGPLASNNPDTAQRQADAATIQKTRVDKEIAAGTQFGKDANGAAFRASLHDAAIFTAGQLNALYAHSNFQGVQPDDVALTKYFDTFTQADAKFAAMTADEQKAAGGFDGANNIQQQLLRELEKDPTYQKSQPYIDAYLAKAKDHEDPTVKAFYDAQKAIRDSGYYDVKTGKADWREANPATDALLRKYGYGQATTQAMDVVTSLKTEQAASDAKLASGALDPVAWRKQLGDRGLQLSGAYQGLYGDLPPKEQTALTEWGNQIDLAKGADGVIDWRVVDNWLAKQPAATQSAIDNRVRHDLSPEVTKFHAAQKVIADSGYWDAADTLAAQYGPRIGLQGVSSWDDLSQQVHDLAAQRAAGYPPAQRAIAQKEIESAYLSGYNSMLTAQHQRMQFTDMKLLRALVDWGYVSSNDALAMLARSGQ